MSLDHRSSRRNPAPEFILKHSNSLRNKVMTNPSGRAFDIIRHISANVVNVFNKRQAVCTAPCDGRVMRLHYQWTFWLLLGGYSAVWYSWFQRDLITCASHFNAEAQIRVTYLNVCLSYPFVEVEGQKRYLLFYRWIHWTLLLLAAIYYLPRKLSKVSDNCKVRKLFEDIALTENRYYDKTERDNAEKAAKYFCFNWGTHDGLFYKYFVCNAVSLLIDVFAFSFLDFLLQYRFSQYGFATFPFARDVRNFSDPMSQTFPPFATCELNPVHELINKRKEIFGCHLTLMEFYEKFFLFLWAWLIASMLATGLYVAFILTMYTSRCRFVILRIAKPFNGQDPVRVIIRSVVEKSRIGDIYLLYRLRQHFSHAYYYYFLSKLADPEAVRLILHNVKVDDTTSKVLQPHPGHDLRTRLPHQKGTGKLTELMLNKALGVTPGMHGGNIYYE